MIRLQLLRLCAPARGAGPGGLCVLQALAPCCHRWQEHLSGWDDLTALCMGTALEGITNLELS
jgi:hypothetical protein